MRLMLSRRSVKLLEKQSKFLQATQLHTEARIAEEAELSESLSTQLEVASAVKAALTLDSKALERALQRDRALLATVEGQFKQAQSDLLGRIHQELNYEERMKVAVSSWCNGRSLVC